MGIETAITHLWNSKLDLPQSGCHGLRFEAIGIAPALLGALIRCGLQMLLAFGLHRCIDHDAYQFWHGVESFLRDQFHQAVRAQSSVRVIGCFFLGCLSNTKDTPEPAPSCQAGSLIVQNKGYTIVRRRYDIDLTLTCKVYSIWINAFVISLITTASSFDIFGGAILPCPARGVVFRRSYTDNI